MINRPLGPIMVAYMDLHTLLGEVFERDGGEDVEVRRHRPHLAGDRLDSPHQPGELGVRDHVMVDADPLANVGQVRAGVQADLVAVGLQHVREHRAGAALALGAGDVDGAELFLGIAELLQQVPHPVQVEVDTGVPDNALLFVVRQRRDEA